MSAFRTALLVAATLLMVVALPMTALATTQLDESFGSTAGILNPTDWVMADGGGGTCLTSYTAGTPVGTLGQATPGCGGTPDPDGEGVLRLTSATEYTSGSILYNQEISTSEGIGVHFYMAMYGGNELGGVGADGMSFFLKNGANASTALGNNGARLGYGGLPAAILGVGFDAFGNFSDSDWWADFDYSASCDSIGLGSAARTPHSVALRSGDTSTDSSGTTGYCYLGGISDISFAGADRAAAAKEVLVTVDPATSPTPMVKVYIGTAGELPATPTISAPAPAEYLVASTFKFGFSASTGMGTNIHEIWGVRVGEKAAVRTFMSLPSTTTSVQFVALSLVMLAAFTGAAGVFLHSLGEDQA